MKSGTFAAWLLAGVVALAPLPFGSVNTGWIALWCGLLSVCVAMASLRYYRMIYATWLAPACIVAVLLVALVAIQTWPDPPFVDPHPVWNDVERVLAATLAHYAAVDPAVPWQSLGAPLAMFLAFVAGLLVSANAAHARLLVLAVAISAVIYALYGLGAHVIAPNALLWGEKSSFVDSLTATFVNRNTAATYFGTATILWLLLGLEQASRKAAPKSGPLAWVEGIVRKPSPRLTAIALCLLVCFLALMLTRSRAGILLTAASLLIATGLFLRSHLRAGTNLALVLGAIAGVGALLFELAGSSVAYRIGMEGLTDAVRWNVYGSIGSMISDRPLLGTGLGTFVDVFPAYRSPDITTVGYWNRAHNTPLGLASEMGLPFLAATVLLWLWVAVGLGAGALRRRQDAIFSIAAVAVGFLGTAHSMVDFPLEIPGYAIVFAALIGCGCAQSFRTLGSRSGVTASRHPALRALLVVIAVGGLFWSLWIGPEALRVERVHSIAFDLIDKATFNAATLAKVVDYLDQTEARRNCSEGGLRDAAAIRVKVAENELGGDHAPDDPAPVLQKPERDMRAALSCAPYNPYFWLMLFWIDRHRTEESEGNFAYLDMSYRLGPHEGWVMQRRNWRALQLLDKLPEDLQQRVLDEFVTLARYQTNYAFAMFRAADEPLRARLLPLLARVPLEPRTRFARRMQNADIAGLVPGVDYSERRPGQQE